jgi:hypothetical protein
MAQVRTSAHHALHIGFGGAFDDASLHGGRRWDATLALAFARPASPWQWELAWTHTRQDASDWQALTRGGLPAGNVRQPRIAIDDVGLRVRRDF